MVQIRKSFTSESHSRLGHHYDNHSVLRIFCAVMEKLSINSITFILSEFKKVLVRKKYLVFSIFSFVIVMSVFALGRSTRVNATQRYTSQYTEANWQRESKSDNLVVSKDKQKNQVLFNETTCSYNAYRRGSGQKIVGFSYYKSIYRPSKKQNLFFSGIKGNLDLMPLLYPGWVMRLYTNLKANDSSWTDLLKLLSSNPNIDLCIIQNLPGTHTKEASNNFGMNWRFYPALDQQVKLTFR